jgi:nicotinamidase-related amidase
MSGFRLEVQRDRLATQLRRAGVDQAVLAGMSPNVCLESHLLALLERGFAVAVVQDATASAALDDGNGDQAALVNFQYIADAVWSTTEALGQM